MLLVENIDLEFALEHQASLMCSCELRYTENTIQLFYDTDGQKVFCAKCELCGNTREISEGDLYIA